MSEETKVVESESTESKVETAIERAMAAVAARKAAKAAKEGDKPVKEKKEKKAKEPVDAEAKEAEKAEKAKAREAKQAELKAQREARKAEREAAKAAKSGERSAKKSAAHMAKVEKAASKLPALNESGRLLLDEATTNLADSQVLALALHLQHHVRAKATVKAAEAHVEVGDTVKIVGGDPRFIGLVGLVDRAQRIRAYVKVEGRDKPVYVFTSDIEKVTAEA